MDTNGKIKILIVDDYDLQRNKLINLFKPYNDLEVVGQTGDAQLVLDLCTKNNPDVVLMDIVMTHMDGATATQLLREQLPHIRVVAMSISDDKNLIDDILEAGAISCVVKNGPADEIVKAVRAAYDGKSTVSSEAQAAVTQGQQTNVGHNLTIRESEVLRLIIKGLNSSDIAKRLTMSSITIKRYVANILSKLRT